MGMFDSEPRVHAMTGGRKLTKQADKDAVNINVIVARGRAAVEAAKRQGEPMYGDFSDAGTYHEMLTRVLQMKEDFFALPAAVRQVAENDPHVFLELLDTDQGLEELLEAGLPGELVPKHVEPARIPSKEPVPPVSPVVADGPGAGPGTS